MASIRLPHRIILIFLSLIGISLWITFRNKQRLHESFASTIVRTCPIGSNPFVDYEGFTSCCDGAVEGTNCRGAIVCSLSKDHPDIPECRTDGAVSIELDEKGLPRKNLVLISHPINSWYKDVSLIDAVGYKRTGGPIFEKTGRNNMRWKFDTKNRIKSLGEGGGCLDNMYAGKTQGTRVIEYKCHDGMNQKYRYWPSTGQIESLHTPGLCIQVTQRNPKVNYKDVNWDKIYEDSYLSLQPCADVVGQHFKFSTPM